MGPRHAGQAWGKSECRRLGISGLRRLRGCENLCPGRSGGLRLHALTNVPEGAQTARQPLSTVNDMPGQGVARVGAPEAAPMVRQSRAIDRRDFAGVVPMRRSPPAQRRELAQAVGRKGPKAPGRCATDPRSRRPSQGRALLSLPEPYAVAAPRSPTGGSALGGAGRSRTLCLPAA